MHIPPGFVAMFSQGRTPFEQSPNLIAPRAAFDILSARRTLNDARCPVLLVIATDDDLVPAWIGREIAERAGGGESPGALVVLPVFLTSSPSCNLGGSSRGPL